MRFRIDGAEPVRVLDRRVLATLPASGRTRSISDRLDYLHSLTSAHLSRDAVLAAVVDSANEALHQFSAEVSEDAREPYNGCVTVDGDLLRVRVGRVPRSSPDDRNLAPELEPIPIGDILAEE